MSHSRSVDESLRQLSQQHAEDLDELAGDLHDGLLQYVIAAHMATESLRRQLDASSAELPATLDSIQDYLHQAIAEGRRLLDRMHSVQTFGTDLRLVLRQLADQLSRDGIRCDACLPESMDLDPPTTELLRRLAQEAVSNVRRHSGAETATLSLQIDEEAVQLEVVDDGVGFPVAATTSGGFGLASMRRRLEAHGGTLHIDTAPDGGTRLVARLPRSVENH